MTDPVGTSLQAKCLTQRDIFFLSHSRFVVAAPQTLLARTNLFVPENWQNMTSLHRGKKIQEQAVKKKYFSVGNWVRKVQKTATLAPLQLQRKFKSDLKCVCACGPFLNPLQERSKFYFTLYALSVSVYSKYGPDFMEEERGGEK